MNQILILTNEFVGLIFSISDSLKYLMQTSNITHKSAGRKPTLWENGKEPNTSATAGARNVSSQFATPFPETL